MSLINTLLQEINDVLQGCREMKRLFILFFILSSLATNVFAAPSLDESRRLYREAIDEISRGRLNNAEKLVPKLNNYPLLPYLELELVKAQIIACLTKP